MKTLVIVPAHDEESKIEEVIHDLKKYGYKDILVIDDGSLDKTYYVAKKNKVKVVRHIINRGLGAALGTGFDFAKRHKYDCLITFDGDGQHRASDLKKLIAPILSNKADAVIGSRAFFSRGVPVSRLVINHISNLATFILYRTWTSDTLSGLRAFSREAITKIDLKTDRMEVSNEFFMEIKTKKLKLIEVPIKPVYTDYSRRHSHNNDSFVNSISIGKGMLLRLFR